MNCECSVISAWQASERQCSLSFTTGRKGNAGQVPALLKSALPPWWSTNCSVIWSETHLERNSLVAAQHAMEMFRRSFTNGSARKCLLRLSVRVINILAEIRTLHTT